jgi:subfamily B ATP-binding cassette protein HlyB/CyaB
MERAVGEDGSTTGVDAPVSLLRFHQVTADPAQIRHQFAKASFGASEMLRCASTLKLEARALTTRWDRSVGNSRIVTPMRLDRA